MIAPPQDVDVDGRTTMCRESVRWREAGSGTRRSEGSGMDRVGIIDGRRARRIAWVSVLALLVATVLLVTCILAFNDSQFPALPWKGFTLDWFFANEPDRVGIFHDQINLTSIWVSARVAFFVTILSTLVGTCGAFLFGFSSDVILLVSRPSRPRKLTHAMQAILSANLHWIG